MEADTIKPFQGPPPTPENFAAAFPQVEAAVTKGANRLDDESQGNLDEFLRQMRSNPPRPATIVNLHPWQLQLPDSKFTRGIVVPACVPGQAFSHQHVRGWIKDWKQNENGALQFMAVNPIHRAREFMRAFSLGDAYGPGVLIYENESHPDKVGDVETYANGLPLTTTQNGFDYDDENNKIPAKVIVPVKRKFQELLSETTEMRNKFYFARVQEADAQYRRPDGKGKAFVTIFHRLMAEVIHAEGLIDKIPEWNLTSKLEKGLAEENCLSCGQPYNMKAFRCGSCGHILNPFVAYVQGAIEYGHVSMDRMSEEEWTKAMDIKEQRAKARAAAGAARGRAAKANQTGNKQD